jgi:hypothetical protein
MDKRKQTSSENSSTVNGAIKARGARPALAGGRVRKEPGMALVVKP